MLRGIRDQQTVTADGKAVAPLISGVVLRHATTLPDERGEICEIYNPGWGLLDAPLVYVYQSMIRPGKVKGWVYHENQEDRLFVSLGFLKVVLFDRRPDSPTAGVVNEFHLSERNRGVLVIPRMVAHAVQNVGHGDALFINMPSKPYNHENPDKFRISLESDEIPYKFDRGLGW